MITREMVAETLRELELLGALEHVGWDPASGEPVYRVKDWGILNDECELARAADADSRRATRGERKDRQR